MEKKPKPGFRKTFFAFLFIAATVAGLIVPGLTLMGRFLVKDETPGKADAIVVLLGGKGYTSRLVEAAQLYNTGTAPVVVINGNRKSEAAVALEEKGFTPACPWYANSAALLRFLGVPGNRIIHISVEDAYDTVSEALCLGKELQKRHFSRLVITTSRYHTRRAGYIWHRVHNQAFSIRTKAAQTDPFDPQGWWKEGQQVRWVLSEYGAWLFYWWKRITGKTIAFEQKVKQNNRCLRRNHEIFAYRCNRIYGPPPAGKNAGSGTYCKMHCAGSGQTEKAGPVRRNC